MKKLIPILFIVLVSVTASAQKCKFDIDKKDPFTGKQIRGNTATLNRGWLVGFNSNGDGYTLGVAITFLGAKYDAIAKGDTMMIALDGSSPVIITAIDKAMPTTNVVGGSSVQTSYHIQYTIAADQVKLLSQKTMTAVKVFFGGTFYMVEIPEGNKPKIMQAANCIMQ